jgi:Tfp pilus assembly protein PilF
MQNSGSHSAGAARLQRFVAYLQEDPGNAALLADACDEAIACGAFEQAQAWLQQAASLQLDGSEWTFRQARLCIARRDLAQAATLLEHLRATAGDHPALVHDLAHVRLLQGHFEQARELLQPWLATADPGAAALPPDMVEALQLLWLRATHRLQLLDEAWAWACTQQGQGALQPAACGAASLIAIDLADFPAALRLSDAALARHPAQPEALVARASVALAQGDPVRATTLLERALQANPEDGRTWSTLGFASLRAGEPARAAVQLERAIATVGGHIGTWHALGWARLLQGDRAGALAAFTRALDLDRNFAESHGAVGLVLALQGQAVAAQRHLAFADKLDPDNITGRYARAVLAGDAADLERLRALAARLLDRPGFFGGKLGDLVSFDRPARD